MSLSRASLMGGGILLTLFLSHLIWGSVSIPWLEGLMGEGNISQDHMTILFDVRLPRALIALSTGMGLSCCGLMLQTWLGNPLAGPSVLGVTSGAGMGVALVVLAGVGSVWWGTTLAAFVGSTLTLAMVFGVSHRFRGMASLLIFGLMLNYVLGALITVLQSEADPDSLQQFVFWGMGTFGQATFNVSIILFFVILVCMLIVWKMRKDLDIWTLGPLTAKSMGVNELTLRRQVVLLTGMMTGLLTAICGPVAFLGLATPHVVKLLFGGRSHRELIPLTAITGGILALLADWGVKGVFFMDSGWPLNAVLSLIGGPMVVWVLIKNSKMAAA